MNVYLRMRRYPETPLVRVWLIQQGSKEASGGFLHGVCHAEQASELAEQLGIAVKIETCELPNADPEMALEKQRDLFADEGTP